MQVKFMNKLKAMTLGEVLITLIVMGVIFALTAPVIKDESDRISMEGLVKKSFLNLNLAVDNSLAKDAGDSISDWDFSNASMLTRLTRYMNVAKHCAANSDECFGSSYRLMNSSSAHNFSSTESVLLSDGIALQVSGCSAASCDINVDLNGANGPNVVGYDVFTFSIYKDERGLTYKDSNDDYGKSKSVMENGWKIKYW